MDRMDLSSSGAAGHRGPNGAAEGSGPGPEHRRLDVFIGKWINEGETVSGGREPVVRILTSDIYEWLPGGFFVLHTAYGLIGDMPGGGVEIIGYDAGSRAYRSWFYDSLGNVRTSQLTVRGDVWTWQADRTRTFAEFSDGGTTQTARHEASDDGAVWHPTMNVVLRKGA